MRTESNVQYSGIMLTGTLVLAGIDVAGLMDYGLKAAVGGIIWLGFKLLADQIDRRRKAVRK